MTISFAVAMLGIVARCAMFPRARRLTVVTVHVSLRTASPCVGASKVSLATIATDVDNHVTLNHVSTVSALPLITPSTVLVTQDTTAYFATKRRTLASQILVKMDSVQRMATGNFPATVPLDTLDHCVIRRETLVIQTLAFTEHAWWNRAVIFVASAIVATLACYVKNALISVRLVLV